MPRGWQQSWLDLLDSVRGRAQGATPDQTVEVDAPEPAAETNLAVEWRKLAIRWFAFIGVIAAVGVGSWLLSQYHSGAGFLAADPPAPDVVATFDGGRIVLADIESHLKLLAPSLARELTMSPESLLAMAEDLISDQLVLRWAAERKPEGEETFRHAVKHIDEELSLESFASQLHEKSVPIAEGDIRDYYEANAARFAGRSFDQAREDVRQILVAEREPQFIESYVERLGVNASVSRNFDLLDVPPPGEEELERYYKANLSRFTLPRRAVVDEIEFPVAALGDAAQQRASDVLLTIRGGASFKEAADRVPESRLATRREVAEGARAPDWEKQVFALVPGELGSVFRSGDAYYVVRLGELKPARVQSLSDVRADVAAAAARPKEQEWFAANGEKTLFTLKGQRYTLKQFYGEYQELPPSIQGRYAGSDGLRKLADSLISRMLLVADTYDKLLDVKTKPLADETRLQLMRQMMEQEEVDDKVEITDAEVQKFFSENRGQIAYPAKARIRYIRIGLGASDDEARRARERADAAYRKLAPALFGDGVDFAKVAKEYSEDAGSAAKGGELADWVGESSDPFFELTGHPFHAAVMQLKRGEIGKPFEVGDSLYIVQVLERKEPQPLSLEEAKPFIEEVLTERKHGELAADLQKRLLKQANVQLYPKVLEAYFTKLEQPAAQDG